MLENCWTSGRAARVCGIPRAAAISGGRGVAGGPLTGADAATVRCLWEWHFPGGRTALPAWQDTPEWTRKHAEYSRPAHTLLATPKAACAHETHKGSSRGETGTDFHALSSTCLRHPHTGPVKESRSLTAQRVWARPLCRPCLNVSDAETGHPRGSRAKTTGWKEKVEKWHPGSTSQGDASQIQPWQAPIKEKQTKKRQQPSEGKYQKSEFLQCST